MALYYEVVPEAASAVSPTRIVLSNSFLEELRLARVPLPGFRWEDVDVGFGEEIVRSVEEVVAGIGGMLQRLAGLGVTLRYSFRFETDDPRNRIPMIGGVVVDGNLGLLQGGVGECKLLLGLTPGVYPLQYTSEVDLRTAEFIGTDNMGRIVIIREPQSEARELKEFTKLGAALSLIPKGTPIKLVVG